jgi:hypothetical protein
MAQSGFRLDYDEGRQRVVITLRDRATVGLWRRSVSALIDAHAWSEPIVYDMSRVEATPLLLNLPNLVPAMERLTQAHGQRAPVAVVVRGSELELWRQRLDTLFDRLVLVEVFADLESAHAWLDRTSPETTAVP